MDLIEKQNNKVDKAIIPALRFPDFQNDGDWEVKRFGEIAKVVDEKCSIGKLDIETYISTENMLQNLEGIKKASKLPDTGSFTRFQKGDILFSNIRPYLKKVWQAEFDGAASNDVIVFRALNGFDFHFVSQIIKSDRFIAHAMAGAKGVKMPRGDKNMMMDYLVCIPSLAEQGLIAACLSALDEMLAATNEKLEQLKAYKKGMMQKLFPAKGKKLPELRFKEFEKDGEWEEKKVSEIFHITRGYVLPTSETKNVPDGEYRYPVYSSQTANNGLMGFYYKALFKDAITWTTDGANAGTVRFRNGEFYCTNVCGVLISNEGYANPCIAEIIGTVSKKYVSLVGNPKLMNNVMAEIPILVPSLAEQRKIADCLTSIDEMINQYTNKIALLELYKKGLIRQLFPIK